MNSKKPSWVRRLFSRPDRRGIRNGPRRIRLGVEGLEDRTVPATFTVSTIADSGTGSLRDAISQANASVGIADTIVFSATVFNTAKTITLTSGQLALTGTTTITGPGANLLSVSGNDASRVFKVAANVTATVSGLTITRGTGATPPGYIAPFTVGGGLANYGTTTLSNCTVSGSSATAGGGLYNSGTITLTGCTVSGNTASGGGSGGGVANRATLTMTACTVSGNTASSGGGLANGIFVGDAPTATLTNCTIAGNLAFGNGGGVVGNSGTATLTNCTVSGNSAGAPHPDPSPNRGSNTQSGAGVFSSNGSVRVRNTIIGGNIVNYFQGFPGRYFTVPSLNDVGGVFTSQGFNLIGTQSPTGAQPSQSSGWISTDKLGTYATLLDPNLAPLGNYGGTTQTMPLLPGSPALNAGTTGTGIPATDQRGLSRVGVLDIGAAESQGYTLTTTTGSTPQTAYAGLAFATPLGAKLVERVTNTALPGATITFTGPAGGAGITPTPQVATTDSTGIARFTGTANGTGGSYTVTATTVGGGSVVSFALQHISLSSIAVTPGSVSLDTWTRQQFTATGRYTDGSTRDITNAVSWASSAPVTATISSTGSAFTSSSGGTTSITASLGGITSPGAVLSVPFARFEVFSTDDSGPGSLRTALTNARNAAPGVSSIITFDEFYFEMPQTITLTSGPLVVQGSNVTITGPVAGVTISGGGVSQVFRVNPDTTASLIGLTIANGLATQGGGLFNSGNLTLDNVLVRSNTARGNNGITGGYRVSADGASVAFVLPGGIGGSGRGGALYSSGGSVTINNSTFSFNTAQGGAGGAGGDGKQITLPNGTGADVAATNGGLGGAGQGGAIYIGGGLVAVTNTTFQSNMVRGGAGGVGGAWLNTSVAGSPGSGGVGGAGQGAAIYSAAVSTAVSVVVTNSTIFLATATAGVGGVGGVNTPTTSPRGAQGASGASQGGAIAAAGGAVVVTNGTFSNVNATSGGGIAIFSGLVMLNNTILGTNTGGDIVKTGGTLTGANNLILDDTFAIAGLTGTIHADPKLAALNTNGGPTRTMALLKGSPAIDAGNNALVPAGVTTDQRGSPRFFKGISTAAVATVDIGAYEAPDPVGPNGDFIVNSPLDDGSDGTLRWAIAQANAKPGLDLITFDATVFSSPLTIGLDNGELVLTDAVTILGPESNVAISGHGLSRVFRIETGVTASLRGLVIAGGSATDGGGLFNAGSATLFNVTLTGNTASASGGGVFTAAGATTMLSQSVVSGNSATDGGGLFTAAAGTVTLDSFTSVGFNSASNAGGGLFTAGDATLFDTSVTGNTAVDGGGLFTASGGTSTLTGATVTGNTTSFRGGGVFNTGGGTTALSGATVSGNIAADTGGGLFNDGSLMLTAGTIIDGNTAENDGGGGLFNAGTAVLDHVTISGNFGSGLGGGGLANFFGTATLTDCTISGNVEAGGGAGVLGYSATTTLTNCTVSGNLAYNTGGGLYIRNGTATLTGCTISGNTVALIGGGLFGGQATVNLTDCTITGNTAGRGGGVYTNGNAGTTTLTNCTVSGNSAAGGGGGLFTGDNGTTVLIDSTVSGNIGWIGGGVYNGDGSTLSLTRVTVTGNAANDTGSGVFNTDTGTADLTDVTVSGNSAGYTGTGVVDASGAATSSNLTVDTNTAGVSGGDVVLTPVFTALSSPDVVYGTTSLTLTGHIGAGSNVPVESLVTVTLDGVTIFASVDGNGNFSATFDPSALVVAGGPYTVTFAFDGNAGFDAVTDTSSAVTVIPAPLTVTAIDASMTYGGSVPALEYTFDGLVNGDTAATFTGGLSTTATPSSPVGDYTIGVGDLVATGNYTLGTFIHATLTVAPATLTITAADATKIFRSVATLDAFTVAGLVTANGDTVDDASLTSVGADSGAVIGAYGIVPSDAIGTGLSNYAITYVEGTLTVRPSPNLVGQPLFAVGADVGGPSTVTVYNSAGSVDRTLDPFPGTLGGVRVAVGDFNGDGVLDIVTGTGPGGVAKVKVLDGATGAVLLDILPFADFAGGVFVATGDVTGDGKSDLVVTPDRGGGPRVKILRGGDFAVVADFFGIDDAAFRGGARPAVGDLTGDGVVDLVLAAGFEGGPRVSVYDGAALANGELVHPIADFFLFEDTLRNGAYVALGDVDADGFADIVGGGGPGGAPRVLVLSGRKLLSDGLAAAFAAPVANFFAGNPEDRAGIRVAVANLDGDASADVVTGAGTGSHVSAYTGHDLSIGVLAATLDLDASPGFNGGVFIG